MASLWTTLLAQSNPGLWPQDKPLYDPGNFCQLQRPSKDSFNAGGQPRVVRTSSAEGMWETQAECCQALWCQGRCDAFAQSPCDKAARYACDSQCGTNPGLAPAPGPGLRRRCLTQKGVQYCGEDCGQAVADGFGCWDEETCEKVAPGDAVHGRRYFVNMETCCVENLALGGSDELVVRCGADPELQRRVTDYQKQEPAGAGGYEDRGEFPAPTAADPAVSAHSPRAGAHRRPRPQQRETHRAPAPHGSHSVSPRPASPRGLGGHTAHR